MVLFGGYALSFLFIFLKCMIPSFWFLVIQLGLESEIFFLIKKGRRYVKKSKIKCEMSEQKRMFKYK